MDDLHMKPNQQTKFTMGKDLYFSDEEDEAVVIEGPEESPSINIDLVSERIKELTSDKDSKKRGKPFCGCGQPYSCTSSLYLHIRSKHGGVIPEGTIGGPKGIIKKPQIEKVKLEPSAPQFHHQNREETYKSRLQTKKDINPSQQQKEQYLPDHQSYNSEGTVKTCKLCGKIYGSTSALKLHQKRKHQGLSNNQPRSIKVYQCSLCGLTYRSRSALSLHVSNKHSTEQRQRILIQQLPTLQETQQQKCGCGRVYQSRSALNMHIKKKHNGVPLKGTTEKPFRRRSSQTLKEKLQNMEIEKYFRTQRSSSEEGNQNSIYDSESEEAKLAQKSKGKPEQSEIQNVIVPAPKFDNTMQFKHSKSSLPSMLPMPIKHFQGDPDKPFRCGCGRTYTCSSSLNLHIKKNHNWIIPLGTIGGPRGIRCQDDTIKQQIYYPVSEMQILCQQCGQISQDSYFKCISCPNHYMCPQCFWKSNNFSKDHEWVIKDR